MTAPQTDAPTLQERLRVHAEGLRGKNDLSVGPHMAALQIDEAADALDARDALIARWQSNSRDTWSAMQAMRDSINEYIPVPSLESDLLQGPENSVFCATLAEAVINYVQEIQKCSAQHGIVTGANTNGLRGSGANAQGADGSSRDAVIAALMDALERVADLSSHSMGMSARDERCVNAEARAALAKAAALK